MNFVLGNVRQIHRKPFPSNAERDHHPARHPLPHRGCRQLGPQPLRKDRRPRDRVLHDHDRHGSYSGNYSGYKVINVNSNLA